MRAVRFELWAEFARRWRTWLTLALAAGVLGGLVAAALAAASRTDSVVARYRVWSLATDVIVGNGADFANHAEQPDPGVDLERIRRLPQVAAATRGMLVGSDRLSRSGKDVSVYVNVEVNPGARGDERIDRWKILAGRRPDPHRPTEALADVGALSTLGIGLGDTFRMRLYLTRDWTPGPLVSVRIVGVRPDLFNNGTGRYVTVSPAFYEAYSRGLELSAPRNAIKVRLHRGSADLAAFQRAAERIAGGRDFQFTVEDDEAGKLQSGFHLQAQALWLAALLAGGAVVLLLTQGLARTIELESERHRILLALGMTRSQLAWLVLGRTAIIGGSAALVTIPVALALSPLAPIGRAGGYEPHPGIAIDARALAAGVGLVLIAAFVPGTVAAMRALRTRPDAQSSRSDARGSAAAGALARAGAPPTLVGGVRMAIPGPRGATAGTARATVLSATVAVAVAVGALGVAASLTHLLGTPRLFGQTWDLGSIQGQQVTAKEIADVRADRAITAAALGQETILRVNGHALGVAAYDPIKRALAPTTLEGRAPTRSDEVLLGTKTADALAVQLGDRVAVRRGSRVVEMTVVGRGVIPETMFLSLGEGVAMTFKALKRLVPAAFPRRLLVRLGDGPRREATLQRLESFYGTPRAGVPRVVRDVDGVRGVPLGLAVVVALFAAATLARTLLLSIRRRRRELAVLKTLGFTRGQVRAMVAWHATTVGAIALAAGVPLGLGIGRWIWNVVTAHLGVAPTPITPVGSLLLAVPAVLLLVNVVAAIPGRLAARTKPAVVLRAE